MVGERVGASATPRPPDAPDAPTPLGDYHRAGQARNVPWSPLCRQILTLLWRTRKPWGAYGIAEHLSRPGLKKHPNSIYRSIKKLQAARLVIPIVSWSRYVISPDPAVSSWGVILCSRCRNYAVVPMEDEGRWLWSVARGFSFRPDHGAIECIGRCGACSAAGAG